jgi:hypothetical protein
MKTCESCGDPIPPKSKSHVCKDCQEVESYVNIEKIGILQKQVNVLTKELAIYRERYGKINVAI